MTVPMNLWTRSTRAVWVAAGALLCAAGAGVGGCNIAAPAFFLIDGPPKTKSVATLDPEKKYVVVVDDPENMLPSRSLRAEIASMAEKTILNKGLAKVVLDHRAAMVVTSKERFGEQLSISEVGQAVGADMVIHVGIEMFALSPDNSTYRPYSILRVKLVDVAERKRTWPEGERGGSGWPVNVALKTQQGAPPGSLAETMKACGVLAGECGLAVAQLFYDHENTTRAGAATTISQ